MFLFSKTCGILWSFAEGTEGTGRFCFWLKKMFVGEPFCFRLVEGWDRARHGEGSDILGILRLDERCFVYDLTLDEPSDK